MVLDECGGAGEEGESEASGEQDRIDRVEFGGRVNKKRGRRSIRIVLGVAAPQKKGNGGGLYIEEDEQWWRAVRVCG